MSTYSSNLRVELITTGTQAGTWGNTTNTNLGTILEGAIAGYATVAVLSANQAFTANDGAADEARLAILRLTTSTSANFAVYAPPVSKQYIIWNNSGYTATIYNSTVTGNTTAAGTGVAIANGNKIMVWSDGTNFYEVQAQSLTATLPIAFGGTGQTTANAAFNALAPAQTTANGKYLKSNGTDTSWDQIDLGTSDITGTLPVANGGTGVTTSTGSGNVVLSASPTLTGTVTAATVSATTLIASGTVTATSGLSLGGNWTVVESGGVLYFKYSGTNKAKLDSSGNLTVTGNVTAYGTV